MARLTARTAFAGLLPVAAGSVRLSEIPHPAITWVAPFRGQAAAVSAALRAQAGIALPDPNRVVGTGDTRAVWFGPDQALLLGPTPAAIPGAAMADQTGGWAACLLEGDGAAAVLSRLVAIDLRDGEFGIGHAARTPLGHLPCVLMRSGAECFEILVFRSMAATCAHEIHRAMRMVAARAAG